MKQFGSDTLRGSRVRSDPAVSVVIPCYNTAQYVGYTLDSLFGQTFSNFEAIVVNDGSPDARLLEKALEPFMDRIIYHRQENRGLAGARNAAIRLARGRYVALLDSDDLWEPEYLEVHVGMLDADPCLDVVFPDARFFGDTPHAGRTSMEVMPLTGEVTWERLVAQKCYVWGGVTMRRDTVQRLGGFDESLRSSEDYDLWLRILDAGGRIGYHRRVLARYRRHAESLSADLGTMFEHHLLVWDKLLAGNLTSARRPLVEQQRRHTLANIHLAQGRAAFFAGDYAAAVQKLKQAQAHRPSNKLQVVVAMLRVMPRVLRVAHSVRERVLFRQHGVGN